MKITITVESADTTVSRSVEIADGNPKHDTWEIHGAGKDLLRSTAAMFGGDPNVSPYNR